jgi:hypothetical protein
LNIKKSPQVVEKFLGSGGCFADILK